MGADCLMPLATRSKTRPDGSPFTIDDREYWHLEKDGGIRRESTAPYPRMVYRGVRLENGKTGYEERIVSSEREWQDEGPSWKAHPLEAMAHHDGLQHDIERAAAEAAYAVQRMSSQAQDEYRQESATNPEHVTDIAPRKKPGRPPKVAVTE